MMEEFNEDYFNQEVNLDFNLDIPMEFFQAS